MEFSGFAKLMRQRRANLPGEVHKVVQNTAAVYLVTISDLTPVDTGAAVSNWQVGINSSPSGVLRPHVPGNFRSTALENLNATIRNGSNLIYASKAGDEIHIVNNIHYITELDQGSSGQAPSGMTSIAELTAMRVATSAKVVTPK